MGVAVIVALVVFLLGSGGGSSKAAATSTPTTTTPPTSTTTPTTTTPTTTTTTTTTTSGGSACGGSFQSCFPPSVENHTFTLNSLNQDQNLIQKGAADAADATYVDNSNNTVDVILGAYPTQSSFQGAVNNITTNLNSNSGCNGVANGQVTDASGNQYKTLDLDCSNSSANISPGWTLFASANTGLVGAVAGPFSPANADSFATSFIQGGP